MLGEACCAPLRRVGLGVVMVSKGGFNFERREGYIYIHDEDDQTNDQCSHTGREERDDHYGRFELEEGDEKQGNDQEGRKKQAYRGKRDRQAKQARSSHQNHKLSLDSAGVIAGNASA